jgi:hypothetical protein
MEPTITQSSALCPTGCEQISRITRRAMECRDSTACPRQSHSGVGKKNARESDAVRMTVGNIKTKPNMEPTGAQKSAIYFKRHKGSRRRAALFRQLRATPTIRPGMLSIRQGFRSEQLSLRGFVS